MPNLYHPERFQGSLDRRSYFEGWYFKIAIEEPKHEVIAFIPGLALGEDSHAFIQVISSKEGRSWYVRFPLASFHAGTNNFSITIGDNHFSKDSIRLSLHQSDLDLEANLTLIDLQPFPVSLTCVGVMGWFAYLPAMECKHGVVATKGAAEGNVRLNNRTMQITKSSFYSEKDWGKSFPSAYLWMQANCFSDPSTSVMLSIARIPYLGLRFTGFLGFVQLRDEMIHLGTYTNAKIVSLQSTDQEAKIVISKKDKLLTFTARMGNSSHLASPRNGAMQGTIIESVEGNHSLSITDRNARTLYTDESGLAGIELYNSSILQKHSAMEAHKKV